VFSYVQEVHQCADNRSWYYVVHIYSSVQELIKDRDEAKQVLCGVTFELMFQSSGNVAFAKGDELGLLDDVLIYINHDDNDVVMWFTVTQAKSYFGEAYEPRFGLVERMPWGKSTVDKPNLVDLGGGQ
jgi:hypothetical protein